jgi:hypothetical protein
MWRNSQPHNWFETPLRRMSALWIINLLMTLSQLSIHPMGTLTTEIDSRPKARYDEVRKDNRDYIWSHYTNYNISHTYITTHTHTHTHTPQQHTHHNNTHKYIKTTHTHIHQNNTHTHTHTHTLNLLSKKHFTVVIQAVKDKQAYMCILKGIFLEQK